MAAPSKLVTKAEYDEPAIAVALGITLLKKAKANTWEQFIASAKNEDDLAVSAIQEFDLSPNQIGALQRNQSYLSLLCIAPMTVPTFCDKCGTMSLQAGTAVKKCINTRGCLGAMYKPAAATKAK